MTHKAPRSTQGSYDATPGAGMSGDALHTDAARRESRAHGRTARPTHGARTGHPARLGWIVFVVALVLYTATANRGAQWQDSGIHILRVVTQQPVNPLGLALSHPLHHWLARLAVAPGLLEPAFSVTLVSAFAAAVAVAVVYASVLSLTDNSRAAVFAAISLMVANTFWQLATRAETYTITAALLAAESWCVIVYARCRRPRHLVAMFLCNGLGVANHMVAALTTPILAVVVVLEVMRGRVRRRVALACGVGWLVGSLPYGVMIVDALLCGGGAVDVMNSALFGSAYAGNVLNARVTWYMVMVSVGCVGFNFPNLLLPASMLGILRWRGLRSSGLARRVLTAQLCVHALFALRYNVVDQHYFFLPMYVLLAVFGGSGFAVAHKTWSGPNARRARIAAGVMLLATPFLYGLAPAVARRFDWLGSIVHHKPYRDDYTYLMTPWSVVERSAERLSTHALALAGRDGLILVEDGMAEPALRYHAIRLGRVDVDITTDLDPDHHRADAAAGRTVVLVPFNANAPTAAPPMGSWQRVGDLYTLEKKVSGSASGRS